MHSWHQSCKQDRQASLLFQTGHIYDGRLGELAIFPRIALEKNICNAKARAHHVPRRRDAQNLLGNSSRPISAYDMQT